MSDVVIVGGGVIGLTAAYELAGQGASVSVLEQGQFGQEASWAGAGILPPCNAATATTGDQKLRALSFNHWVPLSHQLKDETGIDNSFVNCGGLHLATKNGHLIQDEMGVWVGDGVQTEWLTGDRLAVHEPHLGPSVQCGFRLPELCQVRNPRHLKALIAGCQRRGVKLMSGTPVVDWEMDGKCVRSAKVMTSEGAIHGRHFVITAGAWSQRLLQCAHHPVAMNPVRGQIVLLNGLPASIRHVLEVGPRYLVPRSDGRILVGSTEEWVGFDKRNTADGIRSLLEFATQIVPNLRNASVERYWAGLRPRTLSGQPLIDRVPGIENLVIAAGHFRSGLLLSPGTARLVSQLIAGSQLDMPLTSFGFDAHSRSAFS